MGPYQVVRRLGGGGMGEVHLATDPRTGTEVALKTLRPELRADESFRRRFAREVAAAQRVRGTSIARVLAADADADEPWIATEYVAGPTLREAREGIELRALAAGLARALVEIHEAGVVHRDLNPSNVILGADGPKVVDFGIAWFPDAATITQTGTTVGTPAWMAPEQLADDVATAASDVWAWGAVMAFACCGRPPISGSRPEVIHLRASRGELDLEGVPDWLEPLIRRAMDPDPAKRPTAAQLAADLGVTTEADLTEVLERTWVLPPATEVVTDPTEPSRWPELLWRWVPGAALAAIGATIAANAGFLPVVLTVTAIILIGAVVKIVASKSPRAPASASFGIAALVTAGVGIAQVAGAFAGLLILLAVLCFLLAIGADVF